MPTMKRGNNCNCHCVQCPGYSPYNAEGTTSPPHDPAEPSDARVKTIIDERAGETSLVAQTIVSANITGSVTVASDSRGGSAPGSRRVVINATSGGPGPWVAGVILWDDSGYTYDPSVGGSISQLRAVMGLRYTDQEVILNRDDNDRPDIIFGAVIEQDGKTYYSFLPNGSGILSGFNLEPDECWRTSIQRTSDGLAPYYMGRTPLTAEGRNVGYRIADTIGAAGPVGRCDDWLIGLNPATGDFEVDDRPDISHDRISRPVTRFGIWLALSGERADPFAGIDPGTAANDYTLDVLIDDLYLDMATWGVHKIQAADIGTAPSYGTTYVDEDLTTIPAWTQTGLPIINQNGDSEQCWSMQNVSLVDGFVGQDSIVNLNEYDAGRIGFSIANPGLTDASQITLDFTWHTINPRDHFDNDGTGPDPEKSRVIRAGVWFDQLFRLRAELPAADSATFIPALGNAGWQLHAPPLADGGTRFTSTFSNVWGGDDYIIAAGGGGASNGTLGTAFAAAGRPLDGDRYTIIARRRYTNEEAAAINANTAAQIAAGNFTVNPPAIVVYPEAKWQVWVIINGRVGVSGNSMDPVWAHNVLWFPGSTLEFGLIGFCGGRWSNFRLRIS